MKRIRSRKAEKKWRHRFSHYKPMGNFSDAQGQLTLLLVVRSSRNSNLSELSCVSSLPASLKRIGWKTAEKKWRHCFLHYNPMGEFWSDLAQPIMQPFPNPMMLQIKFGCNRPTGCRDIHFWNCGGRRTTTTTDNVDGRTTDHGYTISSPTSLRLRSAKKMSSGFKSGPRL